MNREDLAEACELAGGKLELVPLQQYGDPVRVWEFEGVGFVEEHKGLPAYVASLLMLRVRLDSWILCIDHDSVHFWNGGDLRRPRTDTFHFEETPWVAVVAAAKQILKGEV